jgi:tetratricopeptide (TPR) repeat protein
MDQNTNHNMEENPEEESGNTNIEGEIADSDEAIFLDPLTPDYYWIRGLRKYQQRAYDLALVDFTKTIEITSDWNQRAEACRRRAFCHLALRQYENLIMDANWLVEQGFGDSNIFDWRGSARRELGNFEGAIQDHTIALQLSLVPYYYALYGRAEAYYQTKRYYEAAQDLTQILNLSKIDSNLLPGIYYLRAFSYYRLNEFEKSFDDFNQWQILNGHGPFSDVASYTQSMKNLEAIEPNFGISQGSNR